MKNAHLNARNTAVYDTYAHSEARRRWRRDLAAYKSERYKNPWLPDIKYSDPEVLDTLECQFEIPNHNPFQLSIKVPHDYPFRPLDLRVDPAPDELYECTLGNRLLVFQEDHSPALDLVKIMMSIYSLITESDDVFQNTNWKGKGRVKRSMDSSAVSNDQQNNKRKKLPDIERMMEYDRKKLKEEEEAYEADLQKALAASRSDIVEVHT